MSASRLSVDEAALASFLASFVGAPSAPNEAPDPMILARMGVTQDQLERLPLMRAEDARELPSTLATPGKRR